MVVSEKNIDEWMKTMRESEGQIAVIAMTVRGYENLALNISEMERYIKQQKEVIIYYEKAVAPSNKKKNKYINFFFKITTYSHLKKLPTNI